MGKHVVFDDKGKMGTDLASSVGKLEVLTLPGGLDFHVEVDMPSELEKAMGKDPLLLQKMHDAVEPTYKKLVASLADDFKKFELMGRAQRDEGEIELIKKLPEKLKSLVGGAMSVARDNAEKDALACYDKYVQSRVEYKKYKVKIGATIVGAVGGVVASVVAAAGGAFTGGMSTAVGIIGLIKSAIALTKEIGSALMEVEQAFAIMKAQLDILEKAFLDSKGQVTKLGKANEAASVVLNQFLGISGPCIKNTVGQIKTVKSKTQGIDLQSHALAQTLNKVLKQSEIFENEVVAKAAEAMHKRGISEGAIHKHLAKIKSTLNTTITPLNAKVMELIGKIGKLQKRVQAMEAGLVPVLAKFKTLEEQRGKGIEMFEFALSFSDIALIPLTASVSGEWNGVGQDLAIASGQWAYDQIVDKAIKDTPL